MPRKPLVYVASPYRLGNPARNVHFQCRMFNDMLNDGIVTPHVPLWNHYQDTIFPRPEKDWLDYDNEMLVRMDALLRLAATHGETGYRQYESAGADAEVQLAHRHRIPVFFDLKSLYLWAKYRPYN